MHEMLAEVADAATMEANGLSRLSQAQAGDRGVIAEVRADHANDHGGVDVHELERRLLEFGFVEGARFEILHQGLFGADPIAVKLDDMRVALRRRDASDVWVRLQDK
ncbi:FeoA family protein [Phenylobacterium sp.]|uniref:FeoA family protein n=1 Tax=Phenylobacterium sp. TaxID=1871053 RepID=UPI001219DC13|nr:FeoA family protein [Phenylobacterium sp.]TAL32268.1 MAG: ferrous iron transport protein A [Phenylobacterium sp.]